MAARQGALAAGAARASGERAKRRSTPLIGADPVVLADDTARPGCATPADRGGDEHDEADEADEEGGQAKAVSSKAGADEDEEGGAEHAGGHGPGGPSRRRAHGIRTTVSSGAAPDASRLTAPTPQVRSAPSRSATRQAGERRGRRVRAGRRTAGPGGHGGSGAQDRPRPRVDPREKARRDAARPHLRIAEPPLDPTVTAAPRPHRPAAARHRRRPRRGGRACCALGAEAAGVAPDDVERRVAQVLAYVRRRVDGDYEVDDFGYDADFTEHVFYPMLRPIYRHWFRVEVRGIENIPASGGALVVSNHSGTIALDSLMVQLAIHDEHPQRRVMRALGADLVFQTPFLGTIARRSGSTLAANADAERLFDQGELVGVFPEGFKGVGKPFRERYKLQRFGRGGFVAAALRGAGADHPVLGRGRRGDLPDHRQHGHASPGCSGCRTPRSRRPSRGSARSGWSRCRASGSSSSAPRSPPTPTARARPTTRCSSSTSPTRCARRSSRRSTRCSCSAGRCSSDGAPLCAPAGPGHAHRPRRVPPVRHRARDRRSGSPPTSASAGRSARSTATPRCSSAGADQVPGDPRRRPAARLLAGRRGAGCGPPWPSPLRRLTALVAHRGA